MYKIILADDNPLILRALKKTIPWDRLRITVTAEAEDGASLKKKLKEYRPELLVTDIRMPGFSGLEVAKYLKEQGMDTKVIIITGYQEFQYAQQAVKLGVFDFIVKPIRDEELIRVLQKAVLQLDQEKRAQTIRERLVEENQTYREKIESADKIVEKQVLVGLAHGRIERKDDLPMLKGKKWFYVLARVKSQDPSIRRETILKLREYAKGREPDVICLEIRENQELEFMFFVQKEDSASMAKIRLKNNLLDMAAVVRQEEAAAVCFAVSSLSNGLENLEDMRNQAVRVMRDNFFTAREEILFAWRYETVQWKQEGSIIQDLDRFYRFAEDPEEGETSEKIGELLSAMEQEAGGNEFQIKCLVSELCMNLYRRLEIGKKADQEDNPSVNQILSEINGLADMEQVKRYLEGFIQSLQSQSQKQNRYENPLAGKTVRYVQKHYSDPNLSLTGLAETLNVNASYLSRLLKKETGMNFIDLLTETRINKAKQLLEEGKRVADVGLLVGYKDYSYFYQVFKRVEGIAPTEYKRGMGKG